MDNQFDDLFKIEYNRKNVNVGDILIAEPFLEGAYFARSVVYIVEHDEKGSVGFILNKPLVYKTNELVKELEEIKLPVYTGGPVDANQLFYIHTCSELKDSLLIGDGIYWGGDFKELVNRILKGDIQENQIRFFAGYSGWDNEQLTRELEENSWLIGNISREDFFNLPEAEIWEVSMRKLGGKHKVWANFPSDPILN
ncbi:MAG: YqgE/AlgH family protein [Odoribacter sp.]|nr:YqgE/AlgH family protein [Odoribacter sp.]